MRFTRIAAGVSLAWCLLAGTGVAALEPTPVAIAAGGNHSCALTASGEVLCWGSNGSGETLGYGGYGDPGMSSMQLVAGIPVMSAIAAGGENTCAIAADGSVWCWGRRLSGGVEPAPVPDLSDVEALAAGQWHTCALTAAGAVWCWGENGSGQLGNGASAASAVPVPVSGLASGVAAIAAGGNQTCALTIDQAVLCWGQRLGTSSNVPVPIQGLASGVAAITVGSGHACALVSGAIRCWGSNGNGQLGDGSNVSTSTPTTVTGLAGTPARISAGGGHTCAVTTAGEAWCWGGNATGQLGDGSLANRTLPVRVPALSTSAAEIATGDAHSCALTTQSGVVCWGLNEFGQVGDGTDFYRYDAKRVARIGPGVTSISAGWAHSCAIASSDGALCWGRNELSMLGDGRSTGDLPSS